MPSTTPRDGSSGVEATLSTAIVPVSSSTRIEVRECAADVDADALHAVLSVDRGRGYSRIPRIPQCVVDFDPVSTAEPVARARRRRRRRAPRRHPPAPAGARRTARAGVAGHRARRQQDPGARGAALAGRRGPRHLHRRGRARRLAVAGRGARAVVAAGADRAGAGRRHRAQRRPGRPAAAARARGRHGRRDRRRRLVATSTSSSTWSCTASPRCPTTRRSRGAC